MSVKAGRARLREEGFHLEQPEHYCEEWFVARVGLVGVRETGLMWANGRA